MNIESQPHRTSLTNDRRGRRVGLLRSLLFHRTGCEEHGLPAEPIAMAAMDVSAAAKRRLLSRRGEPLFHADWERALFLHFEIEPDALQSAVPFPLDLHEGRAYISLVAFTLRGMRVRFGGKLGEWLCRPIATHEFLNVRTYVRHRGESGIFFLGEWLSNALSVRLGPITFGLPYRLGRMDYQHEHERGRLSGRVIAPATRTGLAYSAALTAAEFQPCIEGSRDAFLLERYTAFTADRGQRRFFRVWHGPWPQARAEVIRCDDSLVSGVWPWFAGARCVGANYSPGARDVWMGWPHRMGAEERNPGGKRSAFFEFP